jgi:type IV pilus assembly protein PilE
MKQTKSRGFTLIEVMIVVVIISLLSALALSSYGNYIRKARRADAKADLLELAQLIERNYTESNSFALDAAGNAYALEYNTSPAGGGRVFYNLRFPPGTPPTATTYTIEAVPAGPQTDDVRCMTLGITQTGAKSASGPGGVAECW